MYNMWNCVKRVSFKVGKAFVCMKVTSATTHKDDIILVDVILKNLRESETKKKMGESAEKNRKRLQKLACKQKMKASCIFFTCRTEVWSLLSCTFIIKFYTKSFPRRCFN